MEEEYSITDLITTIVQIAILLVVLYFAYDFFTPSVKLDCGTDTDCWNNVTSELIQEMENDIEDDVLDEEYYWDYKELTDKVDNIANEDIRLVIFQNIEKRIMEIETSKQEIVMKELRLQWL